MRKRVMRGEGGEEGSDRIATMPKQTGRKGRVWRKREVGEMGGVEKKGKGVEGKGNEGEERGGRGEDPHLMARERRPRRGKGRAGTRT